MKRFLTALLLTMAFVAPVQALASSPEPAPVTSPEMKKSVSIRFRAGLLSKEARASAEYVLQRDLGIEEVKWRTAAPESEIEVEILKISDGLNREAVMARIWEAIESYDGCEDDY